jgi:hypothetical protein
MSPVWNGAYSAPKGYDLRAPFNVPNGEVQILRVVRPFSVSSTQRNTVVEGFPGGSNAGQGRPGFPQIPTGYTFLQVRSFDYCSGQLQLEEMANQWPPYAERTLMKLYLKVKGLTCFNNIKSFPLEQNTG